MKKKKPDLIIKNPKDGSLLVLVPAGDFLAGVMKFTVFVEAFYMALYPVTNAQYKAFIDNTGYESPEKPAWGEKVWKDRDYTPEKANHPVTAVSHVDARAYCEWAGLRLPRELEWEKAARGIDGRNFPWGNNWDDGIHCRNLENKLQENTAPVNAYPTGCSPYGVYQMVGNVWEWTADGWEDYAYERYKMGDLSPSVTRDFFGVRGGSWDNINTEMLNCTNRIMRNPRAHQPIDGFRCCKNL